MYQICKAVKYPNWLVLESEIVRVAQSRKVSELTCVFCVQDPGRPDNLSGWATIQCLFAATKTKELVDNRFVSHHEGTPLENICVAQSLPTFGPFVKIQEGGLQFWRDWGLIVNGCKLDRRVF